MKSKKVYKKRQGDKLSQTDIDWIKLQNKTKLDEIVSDVDYQVKLGKKYYGERWHTILEKDHPAHREYRKQMLSGKIKYKPYQYRALLQYDLEGNFIREWESSKVWAKETGRSVTAASHVAKQAQGRVMSQKDSAYGFVWKFKEEGYQ